MKTSNGSRFGVFGVICLAWTSASVLADVTVQERTTLNVAGLVHLTGTSSEFTTTDKQRKESDMRCDGFVSLLCGKNETADILRLDRDLEWQLKPKDKSYLETPFPTAEDRAKAAAKLQETLDKMQSCPKPPSRAAETAQVDRSQCDLSPPQFEVKKTGEHAVLLGHDTQKTSATMTQTCTDRKTGDVCDLVYGFDMWLTGDDIQGFAERRAFSAAYLHKIGLDGSDVVMQGKVRQLMAQYQGTFKELAAKMRDFKGTPLRTQFHVAFGGAHCAKLQQQNAAGADGGAADNGSPTSLAGAATAMGGKLLGGLFKKKDAPVDATPEPAAPPGMKNIAVFTVETTAVDGNAIPGDKFEPPAGWKRETPPAAKAGDFSCPAQGT